MKLSPDSIGLLEPRMITVKDLDALMLKIVVHHALVVPGDSNGPLLKLAHDTLATLLGHPRDVTLSACVLVAKLVAILEPDVLDLFINRAGWTTLEGV